ncbi:cation-translocating P-type ATPase [Culicoidibacter larvae]|nr:cation-translocating P-type ATPase [Culicoidibacter larvae]
MNKELMQQDIIGLSYEEVAAKVAAGEVNTPPEKATKTNTQIIKENVLTLFNLLNLLIGIALALVGAFSNMFFLLIILINILIGIIQEIHAKNLVEELTLLSTPKATVIRGGEQSEILVEELVLGDAMILEMGSQIAADSVVVAGSIEVNESLLTGESDSITKYPGDHLLSGSFVVSGKCTVDVEHIGNDNFSAKLAHEAKKAKPINSELLDSMRKITKFTSWIIVPLGVVLFLEAYFIRLDPIMVAVVTTSAALLGMLPKGLVLLISITSATGVIKLSKKQVLVQDMYCMETLAHVDMLCLDKTGTITEGKMSVTEVLPLTKRHLAIPIERVMGSYLAASDDNNATMQALRAHFNETADLIAVDRVAFSSERKWGAIQFADFATVVFGAPEIVLQGHELPAVVNELQLTGSRVLIVAFAEDAIVDNQLPTVIPVAAIALDDPIRKNAEQTLNFFKREGVEVKVISGDNPVTVSNIARKAGLHDYASYIDLSMVTSDEEVQAAATQYSIFGRVRPEQKQLLVQALQAAGHTVAMTGDGVNDVLALREADCSIAMAEGNDAAKQVSQLVLLHSDFSSLPEVLAEGRRVVNNVTKVASVFFIKTIYSVLLSVISLFTFVAFPFIPIQITLIDLAIEGYPAFFLSFEPDKRKVHGVFLKKVLTAAAPNALLIVANTVIFYILGQQMNIAQDDIVTLMYYMIGFISILAVLKTCLPFNPLRIFLFVTTAVGFYVAVFLFQNLLHVGLLTSVTLPIFIIAAIPTAIIWAVSTMVLKKKRLIQ